MSKVWFITGVSSGLGQALAEAALARGDRVGGTVRREADKTAFEASAPDRARAFMLDVVDHRALAAAIQAMQVEGGLDILVNNAGYGLICALEEASAEEVRAQFEVNVFAPIAAVKAALPGMRARGGAISGGDGRMDRAQPVDCRRLRRTADAPRALIDVSSSPQHFRLERDSGRD
jgi:NAD(P)-dependent dehydrogenase (short-subunit alcohol dehydrogenase family)